MQNKVYSICFIFNILKYFFLCNFWKLYVICFICSRLQIVDILKMVEIKKKELNYDVKNIVLVKNEGNILQYIVDIFSICGRIVFSIIVRFKKKGCIENKFFSGSLWSLDFRDERFLVRWFWIIVFVYLGDLINSYN